MGSGASRRASVEPIFFVDRKEDESAYYRRFETIKINFILPPAILLYGPPGFHINQAAEFLSTKLGFPILRFEDEGGWDKLTLKQQIDEQDAQKGFIMTQPPMTIRGILELSQGAKGFDKVAFFLGSDIDPFKNPAPNDLFSVEKETVRSPEDSARWKYYEYRNQEAIVLSYYQGEQKIQKSFVYSLTTQKRVEVQLIDSLNKIARTQKEYLDNRLRTGSASTEISDASSITF